MKKNVILITLLSVFTFCFTGCSDDSETIENSVTYGDYPTMTNIFGYVQEGLNGTATESGDSIYVSAFALTCDMTAQDIVEGNNMEHAAGFILCLVTNDQKSSLPEGKITLISDDSTDTELVSHLGTCSVAYSESGDFAASGTPSYHQDEITEGYIEIKTMGLMTQIKINGLTKQGTVLKVTFTDVLTPATLIGG